MSEEFSSTEFLKIDLTELSALEKAFPKYGHVVTKHAKSAMHESVQYLRTMAIAKAREKDLIGATSHYVNGFQANVTGTRVDDLVGKVRNVSGHAVYVEHGRKPGKMPPYEPIANWVLRKLGISDDSELAKVTFLIRRAIARRGTISRFANGASGPAGARVFGETVQEGRRKVVELFEKAVTRSLVEMARMMKKDVTGK